MERVNLLRAALESLQRDALAPVLDIEWLLLRCDDTLRHAGQLRDSLRQLAKDVARFDEEFPEMLSAEVLERFQETRRRGPP